MIQKLPDKFIFMKVGNHANETFDQILKRKSRELDVAGAIFWGYGGQTCHPLNHVKPFVKTYRKSGNLYLIMQSIESNADPDVMPATEYSEDGVEWKPLPEGILVTGSRYALILDEIKPGQLDFPLNKYKVAVGKSVGKLASEYLRGHVDKGCFVKDKTNRLEPKPVKKADYYAKLKPPYAVMLRGPEKV